MKFTGKFCNILKDWQTGKFQVIFTVNEPSAIAEIDKIKDYEKLSIEAVRYREKRSLDANSYYWLLLGRLADKLNVSNPFMHNQLLRRYGQPEIIDGKLIYLVLPDTDEGAKKADEAETYHIKPSSQTKMGKDGKMYRTYTMLRGSKTYDTKEMSTLINGLVDECKQVGIETITPAELERMMELYDKKHRAR